MWDKYVIDASMGQRDGFFCFCPVETDENGNITSIVMGMNCLGFVPEGASVIGVVHPDGNDAADAFCQEFDAEIRAAVREMNARHGHK